MEHGFPHLPAIFASAIAKCPFAGVAAEPTLASALAARENSPAACAELYVSSLRRSASGQGTTQQPDRASPRSSSTPCAARHAETIGAASARMSRAALARRVFAGIQAEPCEACKQARSLWAAEARKLAAQLAELPSARGEPQTSP
eukprot:CAMPEP_0119432982 /NCGR_PEP_ID=MMETSP1335-20130426/48813_1 /TAXON_ID=259385 /ORGANISM="Chrysoculter rhomboideus, Strain RCC1486" /LENGTH=145 /DNA_ID=CAMNT_0007458817 /DNA_START=335 /DNA_END=770 /DNA_ORIENTATION=-